jgi:predicted ATPase/transcriptional regulator with XRE-family HTH domain
MATAGMGPTARPFGTHLKALREAAGFTQEELATIADLSVHAISALERGERRRPQNDTVRALSAALDLSPAARDAFVASARGYASEAPAGDPPRQPLPVAPTSLVGRESDLERLAAWMVDPGARLVTLVGPGGVGKTRLAVELAHTLAADPAVRVLFVPLAALRDAHFVALAVAEAFGLDDATARDLPTRVRAACLDSPTWLVLDNFEQVAAAAPLVADLLTQVASLRVLVTSRAPLHVRGEREYALDPLALAVRPAFQTPADLADVSAVRLFVSRVQDVRPDFHLTPGNSPVVAAICRRLDGLPLALELAAPWVKALAPEGLLARLQGPGLLPVDGPGDLPERQRTMNATVAWSVQLLDAGEQGAFRRFGVFPGPFSIAAAAAVLAGPALAQDAEDAALRLVLALLDKSLLRRVDVPQATEPLYMMLETVRAYAVLDLKAAGEHEVAMSGLVTYCLTESALAVPGMQGPRQAAWLDCVRDDLENHRAVLGWLLAQGRAEQASELAWSLLLFWFMRGHSAEGLSWFERAGDGVPAGGAAEARSLAGAALLRFTLGDLDGARRAGARVADDLPAEPEVLAIAVLCLAHVEYSSGRPDTARRHFSRTRSLFHDLGIAWGEGSGVNGLAWVALAAHDAPQAARLLDEADTSFAACGPWFRSLGLYLRAVLAIQAGDASTALRLTRESLTGIRVFHDTFAFAYAVVPLLVAAGLLGDATWVARISGTRDAFTDRTGTRAVDPVTSGMSAGAEEDARRRLGTDAWADAYAKGRRASVAEMLREIDAALEDRKH